MFLLHLRNELWKLFGKKRTYIGFGAFLITQNAMVIMFRATRWQGDTERLLAGNGYLAEQYISALTVAVVMLIPQILLLMPLYTTLVGGDMVAKEFEDGTLRMILSRPVSRARLLLAKWLAGVLFCFVLVMMLGASALFFARLWFPWKDMFVFLPQTLFTVLDAGAGLKFYVWCHLFLAMNATVMYSLGFLFSCFNMKPAAATILALSVLFLSLVMDMIPFFDRYEQWFLPYHFRSWVYVFSTPTPWARVLDSQCILAAVALSALIVGTAVFQLRDIKS